MATFNLELTPSLQSSDYHLIQFCVQSQHQLSCNMSFRSVESASPCLLETLPVEILSKIYFYSGNPSFALANKHISRCLSLQFIRLQFCVRLFSYGPGPSPYENYEVARNLGRAQTLVFQKPWFSNSFARKVQCEIMRLQNPQGTVNRPGWRSDSDRLVCAASLAQIPRELLLQKPWGQAKIKLLHRLLKWGVHIFTRPYNILREAMLNAILENNYRAVNLLHNHGAVQFHHKHFQAAVLHDCERRIVEMIVETKQYMRSFIDLSDKSIHNHAMELDQAGNPMGRWLLEDVLREGKKRNLAMRTG